jgi:hypothetical protein
MPYRITSLLAKCDEECVRKWIRSLNPKSKSYAYYFLKYREYVIQHGFWVSAQAMLDDHTKCLEAPDKKTKFKHLDIIIPYVTAKLTRSGEAAGISDKRNTWFAIKGFYEFHRCELQTLRKTDTDKMFAPSELDDERVSEERPLTLEEVHKLIMNSPLPYNAILVVMLQGAMAEEEFTQFNRKGWRQVVNKLDDPLPSEVRMFRSKTSRGSRGKMAKYFCFLSKDAKNAIKDWLAIRPKGAGRYLFVTWRKGGGRAKHKGAWVPVTADLIGNMITKVGMRTKLITKGENGAANRYHVHGHELRDLFRTLCDLHGVKHVAAEFQMGHSISSYRKAHLYDVGFYRREYQKVEPFLNIISNPTGLKSAEAMEQENLEVVNRNFLIAFNYSDEQIKRIQKRYGNLANLTKEDIRKLSRPKFPTPSESSQGAKPQLQKRIVSPEEGKVLINEKNWDFVAELSTHDWVVKPPVKETSS